MQRNVVLQNSMINSIHKHQSIQHLHSCPFCRCKSMDNSINIKIYSKPPCQYNILLGKDFLDKKTKYSKNDPNNQHIYYRNFQSPKRRGLSPNGSKKIVIQYLSPPNQQKSSNFFKPLFKLNQQKNYNNSLKMQQPFNNNISPRNIYTNENTPPKAKFLQQRSSRKNSQDKIRPQSPQLLNPIQNLQLYESQKVATPKNINSPKSSNPINKPINYPGSTPKLFSNNQNTQKQIQISPINRISQISQIPGSYSKRQLQRYSSPKSTSSPFHSLGQSTPQVIPYGNFQSSPILNQYSAQNKILDMKPINQFSQNQNFRKQLRNVQKPQSSIKIIQSPRRSRQSIPKESKFDKTLGKPTSVARVNESDQNSQKNSNRTDSNTSNQNLNRQGGNSQFPKPENKVQSQKNVFQKKKINFNTIQISDNFKTPRSKYQKMKDGSLVQQSNQPKQQISQNGPSSSIGNQRIISMPKKIPGQPMSQQIINNRQPISRISNVAPTIYSQQISGGSSNIQQVSRLNPNSSNKNASTIILVPNKPKQLFSSGGHTPRLNSNIVKPVQKIKLEQQQTQKYQQSEKQEQRNLDLKDQENSQIVTQLQEQLKLNYDYYRYEIPNRKQPQNPQARQSIQNEYYSYNIKENGNEQVKNSNSKYKHRIQTPSSSDEVDITF